MTTLEGDDVTVAKCKEQPEKQKMGIWIFCDERVMVVVKGGGGGGEFSLFSHVSALEGGSPPKFPQPQPTRKNSLDRTDKAIQYK